MVCYSLNCVFQNEAKVAGYFLKKAIEHKVLNNFSWYIILVIVTYEDYNVTGDEVIITWSHLPACEMI